MEQLQFHCQNCFRNEELFNITCIEEVKERIDSNLCTRILYYFSCDNCKKKILEELKIENYCNIRYFRETIGIYNLKLIEQYGFFCIYIYNYNITLYRSYDTTKDHWVEIDKKIMFNSIKDESLIEIQSFNGINISSDIEHELEPIKDKGYEVNLVQTVGNLHYYIVKKPTLTKPARKL